MRFKVLSILWMLPLTVSNDNSTCCMEDCCGEGTAWDAKSASCISSELVFKCECDEGFFCKTPLDQCEAVESGTCEEIPESCEGLEWDFVCGCDDKVYDNECLAHQAGVAVRQPQACFCSENDEYSYPPCHPDYYCNTPSSFPVSERCGRCENESCLNEPEPQKLRCERKPTSCPKDYEPVCGCDGVTYSNECLAAMKGVSVEHTFPCDIECSSNADCPNRTDVYCRFEFDCGLTNGTCVEKKEWYECEMWAPDPVCGCNGVVYTDSCKPEVAGVSIQSYEDDEDLCHPFCAMDGPFCTEEGDFCQFPIGKCGDGGGQCIKKPALCTMDYFPVCGCDGITYGNACAAAAAGVSIKKTGECSM